MMNDHARACLQDAQNEHETACRLVRDHLAAGDDPLRIMRVELVFGLQKEASGAGEHASEISLFDDYLEEPPEFDWDAKRELLRIAFRTNLRVLSDLLTVLRPVLDHQKQYLFLEMLALDSFGCPQSVLEKLEHTLIPPTLDAAFEDLLEDYVRPLEKVEILRMTQLPHSQIWEALRDAKMRMQESWHWVGTALTLHRRSNHHALVETVISETIDPDLHS